MENHIAYKITTDSKGLVCTQSEFENDKMLDLLNEIQLLQSKGIYWIFKQLNGMPEEALCIIDCSHDRIYYHYSGLVDNISDTIKKLSKEP